MLKKHLSTAQYLVLASLAAVGFVLRLRHLGGAPLWLDEGATAALVSLDWTSFGKVMISREMNMAAYYCLLRLVQPLAGSEGSLRWLSVVFGTGSILATWLLAKELFRDRRGQLWALAPAALAAVNGFLVTYSQEARGYAMALCLLTLAAAASLQVLRTGRRSVTWCALGLLAIYCHFYAVLWIAPQAWAIWKAHKHRGREFFAPLLVTTFIGLIPIFVFAVRTRGGQLDWVPRLSPAYLVSIFVQLAGYSGVALILLIVGSILGSVGLWKRDEMASRLVVLETAVPICVLLAFSSVHSVFVARFLIFEIPFLILTAMEGFLAISAGFGAAAFAAILAAMLFAGHRSPEKADWRSMTAYLCRDHPEALAFWPATQSFPYRYYAQSSPTCPHLIFPAGERVAVSDFQSSKQEFDARLCASKAKSVLLVVESESDPLLKIRTPCYFPGAVSHQNGLQLMRLQLPAAFSARASSGAHSLSP